MVDHLSDFEFLTEAAERAIKAAKEACPEPTPGTLPRRGDSLAAHIHAALDGAEKRRKKFVADYPGAADDVERLSIRDNARLLHWHLHLIYRAVLWHGFAFPPNLPLGTLYLAEEAAKDIVSERADVIVANDTGYASMPSILLPLGLQKKLSKQLLPIVLFAPPSDQSIAMLQVLLVHEVGHVAVLSHSLADKVIQHAAGPKSRPEYQQAVQARAAMLSTPPSAQATVQAEFELDEVLKMWVAELLCDDLAMAYAGPSYLYAFAAVVLLDSLTQPSETHPPTGSRVRLMLDAATARGWDTLLTSHSKAVHDWLTWAAAAKPRPTDAAHLVQLAAACRECGPVVREITDARVANPLTPGSYSDVSTEVEDLMRKRVLPAQHLDRRAMNRRAIWLASWTYAFEYYGDAPRTLAAVLDNGELQQHVAKGLEMSYLVDHWTSA